MLTNNKSFFTTLILCILLSGCSTLTNKSSKEENTSIKPQDIYQKGNEYYSAKNYKKSIETFESVKSIYPYSLLAKESLEKLIEIDEIRDKYDDAILNTEELMSYYGEDVDLEKFRYKHAALHYTKLQKQLRDQSLIRKTGEILSEFINDFPNSQHIKEIKSKLSVVNGRLVYREMEIGYFYEIQRNFLTALKRYLIAYHFSKNNHYRDEILYRIYYCYSMVGLKNEGIKYFNELKHEFPSSKWYHEASFV